MLPLLAHPGWDWPQTQQSSSCGSCSGDVSEPAEAVVEGKGMKEEDTKNHLGGGGRGGGGGDGLT